MKNLIIFLSLIISPCYSLFAQSISIELSINWQLKNNLIIPDSIDCIPFLNICYRNNANTPLYFLKVSEKKEGFPILPHGTLLQYPFEEFRNPNYLKRAITYNNYSNNNYDVLIGSPNYYISGWEVCNDTINDGEEHMIDFINDDLAEIYEYINRKNNDTQIQTDGISANYRTSDITQEKILSNKKNQFIFLNIGETYTESYDLVGFNMVGGNFTFKIKDKKLAGFVYTEPYWDEQEKKFIHPKVDLPVNVGKYLLYSGKIYSNDVSIQIINK